MTATALFSAALSATNQEEIADYLGLNVGTIKRWRELQEVPPSYVRDLARFLSRGIDLGEDVRERDLFYSTTAMTLFNAALNAANQKEVANYLGLNVGTIRRWHERREVPTSYIRDLARFLGREADEGGVRDKDQFYTAPEVAKECLQKFESVAAELQIETKGYTYIEPSAGAGAFYQLLPQNRRIGMDIDPRGEGIVSCDYLSYQPKDKRKYIVIGNPPFGLRGHLALQFINHSAAFADLVAFILPPLFNSDGKGVPAKRVKGYKLAHTSPLAANSFVYPDGTPVNVESIFQVWTRVNTDLVRLPERYTCREFIRVYSLSDGGTPSSTRNKAMLYKCDVYLPSTCFRGMTAYKNFEDLPHRRGYGVVIHKEKREIKRLLRNADWEAVAFKSTNGALNLRTSLINSVVVEGGYHDAD